MQFLSKHAAVHGTHFIIYTLFYQVILICKAHSGHILNKTRFLFPAVEIQRQICYTYYTTTETTITYGRNVP